MRRKYQENHGRSSTPTYKAWMNMRTRCNNPNTPYYRNYGGRGIAVCAQWSSFEAFLSDMGEKPDGHTLDRIDNAQGYGPGNCRWSGYAVQSRNKRSNRIMTVFGSPITLRDACDGALMHYATVRNRLDRGMDIHNALFLPVGERLSRSTCKNGHEWTAATSYRNPDGCLVCRTCSRASRERHLQRRRTNTNQS